MTSVYQRHVSQWGPAALLIAVLLLLCGGADRRQSAHARQAQAEHDLFYVLNENNAVKDRLHAVREALARGADPNARLPLPGSPPTARLGIHDWSTWGQHARSLDGRIRRVTALSYAALFYTDTSLVRALLDAGAKVDGRSDNVTPTEEEFCRDLPEAGHCDVRLRTVQDGNGPPPGDEGPSGITALMVAAEPTGGYGDEEDVRLLLDRGARIDARDGDGRTALMYAATGPDLVYLPTTNVPAHSNLRIVRLLLDQGADINTRDRQGLTALMLAVEEQTPDVTALLLARGANKRLKDVHGMTAYAHAAAYSDFNVARVLRQYGVTR